MNYYIYKLLLSKNTKGEKDMTNKLKQKCKKIAITAITGTLSLVTIGVTSAKLLVMSKEITVASTISTLANINITNNANTIEKITSSIQKTSAITAPISETILEKQETAKQTSKEPNYAEDGAIICESIVQATKEYNIPNGNHIFRVEGKNGSNTETKDYPVEFINYGLNADGSVTDITYTSNTSLGDTTTDKKMLIVKYHGNLTINSGVTVTATNVSNYTYKKGMYICVLRQSNQ